MSKMTVIQLLNKIANDEELPKKIKYNDKIFIYDGFSYIYENKTFNEYNRLEEFISYGSDLNGEVEILEEKKETKTLTKKDIEALGYACGEIQKCFTNGWTKSLKNKPLEEEKEIPEKLKIEQDTPSSNYYIRNENGTKCALTKHSKMIAETLNQVIDYLKKKENNI